MLKNILFCLCAFMNFIFSSCNIYANNIDQTNININYKNYNTEQKNNPSIKRLYRSRTDRVIFGVCGGLAKYFEIDPVVIRLAWILLIIFAGTGILFYIIAWLIMPLEPEVL